MAKKKTWREKLTGTEGLPKRIRLTGRAKAKFGSGSMLIPAPLDVDALMRRVPKGKLASINELRQRLAKSHKADIACPITTGIFAWMSAHAADEAETAGRKRITPYWRTLKNGGELNAKYPGGIANLRRRLESEGHRVIQRGKRFFVTDFESALAKL
jgi:hypothetical protein